VSTRPEIFAAVLRQHVADSTLRAIHCYGAPVRRRLWPWVASLVAASAAVTHCIL